MSAGQPKTIFEGSVVGFMEKVRNGTAILSAKPQVSKEGVLSKRGVINIYETVAGVDKKPYFPTISREMKYIASQKSVVISLDQSSLETDSPTEEAISCEEHKELFELMRDKACKLVGKNPEYYPVSFQVYNEEYDRWNMWLQTPESSREVNDPWTYSGYQASTGIPTYCVNGIELVEPKEGAREQQKDRKAVFYFSLGKYKFDPERVAKVQKRKADKAAGLIVEPPAPKKELSEASKRMLEERRKKQKVAVAESA